MRVDGDRVPPLRGRGTNSKLTITFEYMTSVQAVYRSTASPVIDEVFPTRVGGHRKPPLRGSKKFKEAWRTVDDDLRLRVLQ